MHHTPKSLSFLWVTHDRYFFFFFSSSDDGPVDPIPPTISGCPDDITATTTPSESDVAVSWVEPVATSSDGSEATKTFTHSAGESRFIVGTTTVTYTFTDAAEATEAECAFDVIVLSKS